MLKPYNNYNGRWDSFGEKKTFGFMASEWRIVLLYFVCSMKFFKKKMDFNLIILGWSPVEAIPSTTTDHFPESFEWPPETGAAEVGLCPGETDRHSHQGRPSVHWVALSCKDCFRPECQVKLGTLYLVHMYSIVMRILMDLQCAK